jgi:hypothetical protein
MNINHGAISPGNQMSYLVRQALIQLDIAFGLGSSRSAQRPRARGRYCARGLRIVIIRNLRVVFGCDFHAVSMSIGFVCSLSASQILDGCFGALGGGSCGRPEGSQHSRISSFEGFLSKAENRGKMSVSAGTGCIAW